MIKEALKKFSEELTKLAEQHEREKDQKCAQIILARTGLTRLQEKIGSSTTGERDV